MRWRYAEAQATVLLFDGFAVLDRERPDVDSKVGGNRQRLVRRERRPRSATSRASACRACVTNDRCDTMRLMFAIGSTPGFDDGALGSFHGSRRVTQFLQCAAPSPWRASRRPSGASCASPSRVQLAASRRLRAAVCARSSNRVCCRWRVASTRPLSRSWLHTFRSFTAPRLLFDCLVDRFGKPLRRFNTLAPLDSRLSGSQRNAIVSRTRTSGLLRARLVAAALRERLSRRQRAVGGSAPTFVDSLAVWYRVSPGETALPFHRKRPAYEAPTKKKLKYCGDELDPKSRTLLDDHRSIARQMALVRADFVLVRANELMSRAWMKDAADAHARDCPNIKRIINQFNRISRWVASEIVRVTDDAQMRLSMLKRFIELAHCCRDVQNLHAHVRRLRRPQPVGRAAARGPLGGAVDQVGEALRPSSNSSAIPSRTRPRCARCCARSPRPSCRRST